MNERYSTPRDMILFARPSFLSGFARIMDLFPLRERYNSSPTEDIADRRALYSDWKAVGDDIRDAITTYRDALRSAR
jgi:hypothetical protein